MILALLLQEDASYVGWGFLKNYFFVEETLFYPQEPLAAPGFWFGGNQGVTARKALPQGVAGGLAAPLTRSRGRAPGVVWGEAPENFQNFPNFY